MAVLLDIHELYGYVSVRSLFHKVILSGLAYYDLKFLLISSRGIIYVNFEMETQMRHLPEEGRLLEEVVHGEELIDYNFLRNVWGSYSCEGEGVDSEDKLDHINKIVGIIKTHVKMMVLSEGKHHKAVEDPFAVTQSEPYQALKAELD